MEEQSKKINNMEGIMEDYDYHLRKFSDPSTDESAAPFLTPPKIPTIKDRVIGILTSPSRQLKKDLERRDIFIIVYFLSRYLNCRATLETYHLSNRSVSLIKTLWMSILPSSFMKYIHEEKNIVLFSPHSSSTFKKRCSVLKQYFNIYLKEICTNINQNLPLIRYVYAMTHAEIYYASDNGLSTSRKITLLLRNRDPALKIPVTIPIVNTPPAAAAVVVTTPIKTPHKKARYDPYDYIKR